MLVPVEIQVAGVRTTARRVEAVFIGAGIAARSPSQGRIGGLVGGAVGRAGLVERTGAGKSTCLENGSRIF